jgi:DNA modification methylase
MLEFHHEDCITFMKKLDDNSVDLTLTDIPYDVVNNYAPVHGDKFWLSSLECCVFARKSKATFNEHCSSAVWRESIEKQIKHHPTPKPVKLLSRLIKASTTPDDTVFDPCMGSGSTGMAAKATRRNFIGCDLDPEYVRKASEWIDSLTESEIESRWKGVADTKTPGPLDLLL